MGKVTYLFGKRAVSQEIQLEVYVRECCGT